VRFARSFFTAALLLFFAFLVAGRQANGQPEIVQYRGKLFSVLAPGSCERLDKANFELVLTCEFRGKNVHFYLKEGLPIVLRGGTATDNYDSVIRTALETVANNLDIPGMVDRIKFGAGTGSFGPERTILTRSGFLYQTVDDAQHSRWNFEKQVLLRLLYSEGIGSAVLVALSDFQIVGDEKRQHVDYPEEVKAILVSLDRASQRMVL
jgi:hypothetical protein